MQQLAFPLLDRFIDYKEQGLLSSAEETADKLIAFMASEDFKTVGPIADIQKFLKRKKCSANHWQNTFLIVLILPL